MDNRFATRRLGILFVPYPDEIHGGEQKLFETAGPSHGIRLCLCPRATR